MSVKSFSLIELMVVVVIEVCDRAGTAKILKAIAHALRVDLEDLT